MKITVSGQVQGVGFRPCVHRVAAELQLTGHVKNHSIGVIVEVQGKAADNFLLRLNQQLPSLAKIDEISIENMPLVDQETSFRIMQSEHGEVRCMIPPDTSVCDDCLDELFDVASPYYRYPFLNCTACGPRLTIACALPYDRNYTSLKSFALCETCEKNFHAPKDRRYHAQAIACAACGPSLSSSINSIADAIHQGEIVTIKGVGGYQWLCDAQNKDSVARLRAIKQRLRKPFALMVKSIEHAKKWVRLTTLEQSLLLSKERPIVLAKKKDVSLSDLIAPGLSEFGIMLPNSALHYLLFEALGDDKTLVVTSANKKSSPMTTDDAVIFSECSELTAPIISYNRDIVTHADDSVVKRIAEHPLMIRRSRGYVPEAITLPFAIPSTLALGGHLKNTFCITKANKAYVSQFIGDLNSKAMIDHFHRTLDHWLTLLNVTPARVAHDLHPDYYTTHYAQTLDLPCYAIQHHHAHMASLVAEHGIDKPVLGVVFDGYGYGTDGKAWGGELFYFESDNISRLGSLHPLLQPGGDVAAREPWRMAAAVLHQLQRRDLIQKKFGDNPNAALIAQMLDGNIRCPSTTSCGRLFDAVSALLGVQLLSDYEGEAAMRLESLVTDLITIDNTWRITHGILDVMPLLEYLLTVDDPILGAGIFHGSFIMAVTSWIIGFVEEKKVDTVLLSGGCFQNKVLTEGLIHQLAAYGVKVMLPKRLPLNDGAIALGQAWIAGTK